jgi:hypothetical protein
VSASTREKSAVNPRVAVFGMFSTHALITAAVSANSHAANITQTV